MIVFALTTLISIISALTVVTFPRTSPPLKVQRTKTEIIFSLFLLFIIMLVPVANNNIPIPKYIIGFVPPVLGIVSGFAPLLLPISLLLSGASTSKITSSPLLSLSFKINSNETISPSLIELTCQVILSVFSFPCVLITFSSFGIVALIFISVKSTP